MRDDQSDSNSTASQRRQREAEPPSVTSAQEAEQYRRELEEDRLRSDQFAHLVSHELRGPLTTLIGYAQLLGKGEALPLALREKAAKALLDQAKRINHIVDNLLQASRLSAGRFRLERQPTDLVALVQQVVEQQQASCPSHRLLLSTPGEPIIGQWDAGLITLALLNLISNAVKFSPQGGDISISVRRTPAGATLTVADQGVGIAPEDLPDLFRPYHRPASSERFPGLGVGLYVVKGIIEGHGGQVTVSSAPGKGTTFTVTLPYS